MTAYTSAFQQRLRVARSVGAAALLALTSSMAAAQAAPGVVLACPTPTSTGVTVDLSTAPGVWEIQAPGGGAWAPATTGTNGAWLPVTGATWIGNGGNDAVGTWQYRVAIDASGPNIDLASANVTFSYRVDNTMVSSSLAGTALPVLPTVPFNATNPGTGGPISTPLTAGNNELLVVSTNDGTVPNPYGLAMQATLTFDCTAGVVAPVPADAPWALFGLSALMLAGVAYVRRKRG